MGGASAHGGAAAAVHDPWVEHAETLARRCASARDVGTLALLAAEIRAVAAEMLADDAGGGPVARVLSALGDVLTARLIDLASARHRLPAAAWCWLALGSEGRGEQTFVTDQDNGLIFAAADAAEARALRPLFLAWAGEINRGLAECGFALCAGGVMAGNADCCLALDEWRERFSAWVRTPDPRALLNATIYFDFRALHGDATLADALRAHLRLIAPRADAFLHMLAANALTVEPPLGRVREFAAREGRVDLKKFGARLFVDAARVLAIDCPMPGTAARLRHLAAAGAMPADEIEAAVGAFHQLQRIRLAWQQRARAAGAEPANQVVPGELNEFDRRVLRETLKQARLLQLKLKTTHRIEG